MAIVDKLIINGEDVSYKKISINGKQPSKIKIDNQEYDYPDYWLNIKLSPTGDATFYIDNFADSNYQNKSTRSNIIIPRYYRHYNSAGQEITSKLYFIDAYAFNYNTPAKSVRMIGGIDRGVTVYQDAFHNCPNLETIDITEATYIYSGAIDGCSKLKYLYLPFLGRSINDNSNMFLGHIFGRTENVNMPTSLKEVSIKHGNKFTNSKGILVNNGIKSSAFKNCEYLTNIVLPDSLDYIEQGSFDGCTSLVGISDKYNRNMILKSQNGDTIVFLKPVGSTINFDSFDSGVLFGHRAFIADSFCSNYSSINLPNYFSDYIISIGSKAFYNLRCGGSGDVTFDKNANLKYIYESAFQNCQDIYRVTFPSTLLYIGKQAFKDCPQLVSLKLISPSIYIGEEEPSTVIDEEAFSGCTELYEVDFGSVKQISKKAFQGCVNLGGVSFPSTLETIGEQAFQGCTGLLSIKFDINNKSALQSIGYGAFRGCSSLTSITIPFVGASKNATSNTHFGYIFGVSGYQYHDDNDTIPDSLQEVTIMEGQIYDNSFYECRNLVIIHLGDGVTSIGEYAFWDCDKLRSIRIPNSVTSIGSHAFDSCGDLTSVDIGNGVTSIGNNAFWFCRNLQSALIGSSVTIIGERAFQECNSLTSILIPDSVTSIGEYAFSSCTNLMSVTIGNGITEISGGAFTQCGSLTNVVIPKGVTSIGTDAFSNCDSLTNVVIPDSVTWMGSHAFADCDSLTNIYYEGTKDQWSKISTNSLYPWDQYTGNYTIYCTDGNISKA